MRSGFATARVTTPPFCEPPRSADGVYRVAVMLFYYSDYLAVAQLPATVADARRTLFGTADNGSPNSGLFFGQVPLATEVERLRG